MILITQKVFNWKHNMLKENPDTSQFSPLMLFTFQSFHLFTFSHYLLQMYSKEIMELMSCFPGVCFHEFSAGTKLPKTVPYSVEHPSWNYLGEMFKNLEKMISFLLVFHLIGNKCSLSLNWSGTYLWLQLLLYV